MGSQPRQTGDDRDRKPGLGGRQGLGGLRGISEPDAKPGQEKDRRSEQLREDTPDRLSDNDQTSAKR
jgi:hypothetical protein